MFTIAEERLKPTQNNWPVMGGVTDDASLEPRMLRVDPSTNRLKVDASISGIATAISDGDAVNAANDGTMVLGTDGSNYQVLKTDLNGELQVDILSLGDGTNTANILKSDGTAAGQNALIMAGGGMTTGTLTLNAGSPATDWYDMLNYAWATVEVLTNSGSVTLTFQGSGDAAQTNTTSVSAHQVGNFAGGLTNTTNSVNQYEIPRQMRYFRISSNASGGNSATLVITFHTVASQMMTTLPVSQSGTWTVGSNSPTGSAVPANAFFIAGSNGAGNLEAVKIQSPGDASASTGFLNMVTAIFNGTNYDRLREISPTTNSTGTGILSSGLIAQFDDTSPTTITENQFGNVRMSENRNLYGTIRDAAGNERGANVNSSNQLSVSVDATPRSLSGPGQPGTAIDSYTSDDVNLAANTANQSIIAAPGASKQIWIYGLIGTADVAGSISIQDEDDTALSGVMPVSATGGFVMNPSGNFSMPWIKVATNKAVEIDTVTCTFDGIVIYAIVSV